MIRTLAVGPHPDDVESSIGGVLVLASGAGHEVFVTSPPPYGDLDEGWTDRGDRRLEEAEKSAEILGGSFDSIDLAPYLEDRVAVIRIVEMLRRLRPEIVLVNAPYDRHPFHRQIARWVQDACFLSPLDHPSLPSETWSVTQVYWYRTVTTTRFSPTHYIDVSPVYSQAERSLRCHATGLSVLPGLQHWSRTTHVYDGLVIGRPYAEALSRVAGKPFDLYENRYRGELWILSLHKRSRKLSHGGGRQ